MSNWGEIVTFMPSVLSTPGDCTLIAELADATGEPVRRRRDAKIVAPP